MKKTIIILLSFLTLFLVGCSAFGSTSNTGLTENYRKGVEGIELGFVENMPSNNIYFNKDLRERIANLGVIIYNKGAYDSDNIYLVIHGYDPYLIEINAKENLMSSFSRENLISRISLDGRSLFNPVGGRESFFFDIGLKSTLPGSFNEFETPLIATVCYDYKTVFEDTICIDPELVKTENSGKKACTLIDNSNYVPMLPWEFNEEEEQDKTSVSSLFGSKTPSLSFNSYLSTIGQGAPLAITNIETRRRLTEEGVSFNYLIYIANLGSGEVISKEKCFDDSKPLQNNVSINVFVGNQEIECNLNQFKIVNGEQKLISCYYNSDSSKAYETTLRVELNYDYSTSISRITTLKRE